MRSWTQKAPKADLIHLAASQPNEYQLSPAFYTAQDAQRQLEYATSSAAEDIEAVELTLDQN